jgi:uncharacterized protein
MQINVSQLLKENVGAIREYEIDEEVDLLGEGNKSHIKGECRLLRTNRSILTSCTLETKVGLRCSRCLRQFRHPLTIKFEEEFFPTIDILNGAPLPAPDEASSFTIDDHHILDLNEPIRQYTLTSLPMKSLCQADCAGLCQTCGKNLNEGQCDCPSEEIDPRWTALTKIKSRKNITRTE